MQRFRNNLAGTITEHTFHSAALNRDMPYDIYFPPGYDSSSQRYPVLYMLHGGGGHRDEWPGYGFIDVADKEIREGRMQPMIIVFPQGDTGYWTNNADGGPRWVTIWCRISSAISTPPIVLSLRPRRVPSAVILWAATAP